MDDKKTPGAKKAAIPADTVEVVTTDVNRQTFEAVQVPRAEVGFRLTVNGTLYEQVGQHDGKTLYAPVR